MAYSRKQGIVASIVGGFILVVSLVMLIAFPVLYKKELERETTLVNNTVLFDLWKDLPIPIFLKLHFFNITNRESFKRFGAPLEVDEVGPYTYTSKWVKEEIRWENGTVSYKEKKTFFFDRENSVGSEDDYVYSLNGPLIFAVSFVQNNKPHLQKWANVLFRLFNENLVVRKKIGELAFGGYSDLIIKYGKYLQHTPFVKGDFAWLYGKNETDDGLFTVYTGEYNHSKLNFIKEWNGKTELTFWKKGSRCNEMEGTNAEVGPPLREKQTNFTFFQPLLCRSMTFDYGGKVEHLGITTKRFKNTAKIFANAEDNPDNSCFYSDTDYQTQLFPSGVLNVSSCQFGAPVMLSFPHFYLANGSYLDMVMGLKPNESLHESFVDIEPITGVSIALAVRFQVNAFVRQNRIFQELQNITTGVYPIFWMEMVTEIDENLSQMMNNELKKPKQYAYSILGILTGLSACLLVAGLFIMNQKKDGEKEEERKPLLERDEVSNYGGIKANLSTADDNLIVPGKGATSHICNQRVNASDQSWPSKQCETMSKGASSKKTESSIKTQLSTVVTEQKKTETRSFFDRTTVP